MMGGLLSICYQIQDLTCPESSNVKSDSWKALSNWDKINASKATITDSLATGKQATFYTRLVDSGLYVYMLANHNVNVTYYLESEWWKNTNFGKVKSKKKIKNTKKDYLK